MSEDCPNCVFEKTEANCRGCFEGSHFKPKFITNADRIRAMTDEELAEFMFTANGCPMWVSEYSCKEDKGCRGARGACWLDWLRQEATE